MSGYDSAPPSKFLNIILFIYRLYILTELQLKGKVFNLFNVQNLQETVYKTATNGYKYINIT